MSWGRVLLWLVLGLSLFANAVVLGLVLRFGGFANGDITLRSVWNEVPADARAEFRAALAANRGEFRQLVADLRTARSEMLTAAQARPYDPSAVVAAQERVRDATEALQVKVHGLMLRVFDRAAGIEAAGSGGP